MCREHYMVTHKNHLEMPLPRHALYLTVWGTIAISTSLDSCIQWIVIGPSMSRQGVALWWNLDYKNKLDSLSFIITFASKRSCITLKFLKYLIVQITKMQSIWKSESMLRLSSSEYCSLLIYSYRHCLHTGPWNGWRIMQIFDYRFLSLQHILYAAWTYDLKHCFSICTAVDVWQCLFE